MASSIFTFDPNPPRVASPWPGSKENAGRNSSGPGSVAAGNDAAGLSHELQVEKLAAELHDGPIEYKLHLLLRPRRAYEYTSTSSTIAGSQHSRQVRTNRSSQSVGASQPPSSQTRQNRLQSLTTQLLWRLQQSSPYHSNAKMDLVIPKLPEDSDDLAMLEKPQSLLPGLEESNGALYEIGVSDDGAFVGLVKDEMDESMTTLKVMASSLGCRVEVRRMVHVGNCEWNEPLADGDDDDDDDDGGRRRADLWVAEAFVSPILEPQKNQNTDDQLSGQHDFSPSVPDRVASKTEQLRVSLVGPTTSGKTTLVGTLAHGTLDNGRGSGRINLLKHRHELASGQTSSVTQELIGYHGDSIFNYVSPNIETWTDIHDHAGNGRLVFFSDSAGHLRFRRTTLRGLVGWAPHWTIFCISAIEAASPPGKHSISGATDDLAIMTEGMGVAIAFLELCLRLENPLIVAVTKYDLAKKDILKQTLSAILDRVKSKNRTPKLLIPSGSGIADMTKIPSEGQQKVDEFINATEESGDPLSIVPIVLTSAVKGHGIGTIHALLKSLPMPPPPTSRDYVPEYLNPEQPAALFHIDDKFELESLRTNDSQKEDRAIIVGGYVRFGTMSIGDKIVVGPFQADEANGDHRRPVPRDHPSPGNDLSISHPSSAELARLAGRHAVSAAVNKGEWHNATIVNIRNLRLPVRSMEAGQAGTIQIIFDELAEDGSNPNLPLERSRPSRSVIRKGQVLAIPSQHMLSTGLSLQAAKELTVLVKRQGVQYVWPSSLVSLYAATVRASARVVDITRENLDTNSANEDPDDVFKMDDSAGVEEKPPAADANDADGQYTVKLELLGSREWIEMGARVVLMEGAKNDSSSLTGYVGKVIEIVE